MPAAGEAGRLLNEPSGLYKETLQKLGSNLTFEIFPLEDSAPILASFPSGSKLAVSSWHRIGPSRMLKASRQALEMGIDVTPNVAARSITNKGVLREIGALLERTKKALIVGGDNAESAGAWGSSQKLLVKLKKLKLLPEEIFVAGHPEGLKKELNISDDQLIEELKLKQRFAEKNKIGMTIITQMCLSAEKTIAWIKKIRQEGIKAPIIIGLPGTTKLSRIMRFFSEIGFADSLEILGSQSELAMEMAAKSILGFSPEVLVEKIVKQLVEEKTDLGVIGFRIFTFNDLEDSLNLQNFFN
ncbi:methylenetetrahydrofolate reductase [Candidatus Roizmanbacteria bacterium]|nr:methylenetetrahydrofolate reductase [Candidatus Roizmanbacteria bacterium]